MIRHFDGGNLNENDPLKDLDVVRGCYQNGPYRNRTACSAFVWLRERGGGVVSGCC
jgi:hypothetical protein